MAPKAEQPIVPAPADPDSDELSPLPELATLSAEELLELDSRLTAEFDELFEAGNHDAAGVARLEALAGQMEAVRGENDRRVQEAEENAAKAAEIAARVRPAPEAETPEGEQGEAAEPPAEAQVAEQQAAEAVEPAAAPAPPQPVAAQAAEPAAAPAPVEPMAAAARQTEPARARRQSINRLALAQIAAEAPPVQVGGEQRERLVITAAADVPGFAVGGRINDREALAHAAWGRARHLPVTASAQYAHGWTGQGGIPIATIERPHDLVLSYDTPPEQIEALLRPVRDPQAMVAAGGWCAPSMPLYEFFNISAADGLLDLPTVGVTRGGIRWPVSPSLADVLESVWLWTEQNDIDAVTGTGTKPCARVPCADFSEARLAAHGICVTAGNLTDAAFPESTRNFVKLLMDAHAHVMNARHVADLIAAATGVTVTSPAAGAAANILAATELQAIDYREKYGMSDSAILEAVYPRWLHGVIRADLSRRSGVDLLSVTDAQIAGWFDDRQVRAQFIADYQSRAAGFPGQADAAEAWPETANFLLYAAGTAVLGEGPTIDLGVVRDSVLNATNDHTAAWTEETSFVAVLGHEVRDVEVAVCPDGGTGVAAAITCPTA